VFAQIFNSINSRRIDNKKNIFEGIMNNYYFLVITGLEIVIQILIVFYGSSAFQVVRIGGLQWGISLALGLMSIPIGFALRLIPNAPVERFFVRVGIMSDHSKDDLPKTRPNAEDGEWNSAISLVRDNLNMFSNIRGGRLRASSFVKSRSERRQEAGVPSLMTMVPSLIASSIGAGWAPNPESLSDPTRNDPSRSSAALWEGKVQLHPDTKRDDPAFKRWGGSRSQEGLP